MNLNLTTVAFPIAALGLVAAFDLVLGASVPAGMTMLVIGGVLFLGQFVEPIRIWPAGRRP